MDTRSNPLPAMKAFPLLHERHDALMADLERVLVYPSRGTVRRRGARSLELLVNGTYLRAVISPDGRCLRLLHVITPEDEVSATTLDEINHVNQFVAQFGHLSLCEAALCYAVEVLVRPFVPSIIASSVEMASTEVVTFMRHGVR